MINFKKTISLMIMTFIMVFLVSCGFKYPKSDLKDGVVGQLYNERIDHVEGTDSEVNYSLKEGSTLPTGLVIMDGTVIGVPEEAVTNHKFTIVATAGKSKKEASFEMTIAKGHITFEDSTVDIIVNKENSGTVNIATGAANIKYEIIEGEDNLFDGLSIAENGDILGTYDRIRTSREIKIRATANDAEPAEANIQIRAINDYLDFEDSILTDAREGLNYAASVATLGNEGVIAKYSLADDSKLPAGLKLSDNGTITGIPTKVGPGVPFTVVATAPNFSRTEATFIIDVILNHKSSATSKIINFGTYGEVTPIKDAVDGHFYVNQNGINRQTSALNNNAITYTLVAGKGELPSGLTLYPNGAIIGSSTVRGEYTFTVRASAEGCEDVFREFSINVQGSRISFESQHLLLTRGEEVNISIAKGDTGDSTKIKYTMTEEAKKSLLDVWGLSLSEEGMLTGKPKKSIRSMNFPVTAEAEGFSSTTAIIYAKVQEPLTKANVFEAEYVSLEGKTGTGYSGAPTEENMITAFSNASNGHVVNYLHNDQITLEFVIWAEEAVTDGVLFLGLGSELGNVTLNPNIFGIYTYDSNNISTANKKTVNYSPFNVSGAHQEYTTFQRIRVSDIQLVKGYNIIQLAVHANTLKDNVTGGPAVDFLEIQTSINLMWHPAVYNYSRG